MREILQPRSAEVSSGAWRYSKLSVNICSQTTYLTMLTATTLLILFLWLSDHNLLLLHTRETKHKLGKTMGLGVHLLHFLNYFFSFLNLQCKPLSLIPHIIAHNSIRCGCRGAAVTFLCSSILSWIWSCFTSNWADPDLARLCLRKPWDRPQGAGKHYRACSYHDLTLDKWKTVNGCSVWILANSELMNYSGF